MRRLAFLTAAALAAAAVSPDDHGIDRDRWAPQVLDAMNAICDAAYFKTCFVESRAVCLKETRKIGRQCGETLRDTIPANFPPDERAMYGAMIGECVGKSWRMS